MSSFRRLSRIIRSRLQARPRSGERGQVLVVFVLSSVALIGGAAIAADVSWLFVSQQKMQRAADAAALAGAIFLPGNPTRAFEVAREEAARNGFPDATNGVVITPNTDPGNPRRLIVDIQQPVGTYFARVFCVGDGFCLERVDVAVEGRAEYVLPVPMGSPLNYYGVGNFRIPTVGPAGNTGARAATANDSPSGWSSAGSAFADGGSSHANDDDGEQQGYKNFGFTIPSGSAINGIDVRVKALSSDSSGCSIGVELSWNNGAGGSYTARKTVSLTGSFPASPYSLMGSSTDNWGHTWTDTELGNGMFRLMVTDVDPGFSCTDSATTSLDYLNVTVYYTEPTTVQNRTITSTGFSGGTVLPSQGFWGAIEGQGSNRSTGDAYATGLNGSGANADYDPLGYDYTVELPNGGSIKIFDPTFCATSTNGAGHFGTGDHWLGNANAVSTYFVLWNTNGTPVRSLHTPTGHSSGTLFENEYQADLVTDIAGQGFSDAGEPTSPTDCGEGRITDTTVGGYYHNRWWTLASNLQPGTYRIQVTTTKPTSPTANADESFENMWSLMAEGTGSPSPSVYGSGRMVSYNNIESGGQTFHLAQVDRDSGAGKTVEIRLFDPGDVGAKAWLEILSPDGNTYDPVTFDYSADNGRNGDDVTCIQTYGGNGPSAPAGCPNETSGGTLYQNSWITINVPLPTTYGDSGLTPSGETEAGWWKVRYTVNSGNDTTTWEVNLRGNPVHLVIP